jgi:hypothetical protein
MEVGVLVVVGLPIALREARSKAKAQ